MRIVPYTSEKKREWDDFVLASRNGTFLHFRDYMDYHAHRFVDASLMCYRDGKLVALLPANWVEAEHTVYSHQGLTYGGLLMGDELTSIRVLEIFEQMATWMRLELKAKRFVYKPIPYIYSLCPSQEDLYALFRMGADIHTRAIASVVEKGHRIAMRKGRKSSIATARKMNVTVKESIDFPVFWRILEQVLHDKFQASPVHSLDEMKQLHGHFPENIHLYAAYNAEGMMIAGTVIYEMPHCVHAQYIASTIEGKDSGAVDAIYGWLIEHKYADKRYIDLGTSVEQGGRVLNEGLIRQKEAFGARGVVYDSYVVNL